MTPERWTQIETLYEAALQLQAEKRGAFIDHACSGDEELRRELRSLIRSHERSENFIESPAIEVVARLLSEDRQAAALSTIVDETAAAETPTPKPRVQFPWVTFAAAAAILLAVVAIFIWAFE